MIINPTFEEFMADKKVFHPELKGQYKILWKLYCTKMKSCYSKHSCTMFEAWRIAGNKSMDIGWSTKFICPFTKKHNEEADYEETEEIFSEINDEGTEEVK